MQPGCGFDAIRQIQLKDPFFANQEKFQNEKIRNLILQKQSLSTTKKKIQKSQPLQIYTIPVVFHIINSDPTAITDLMIAEALNELNDAFGFRGAFQVEPNGANTMIQFCLARTDPKGGLTYGIERINSYFENVDVDMETGELPNLTNWDPARYANIWVVNSIQGEVPPTVFSCGKWERMGYGGYASAGVGVVVAGLNIPTLTHEMGHYLSLLHTFQGTDCLNNDCTTDGDLVCDTPPDRSINGSDCNNPENSCNTDSLSGPFTTDVPDNIANFMDYGSPCPTMFTQGQADRMRAFLETFNGGSLIASNACDFPCTENIQTNFDWYANPHPKAGSIVPFKNNSSGATQFRWYINDVLQDSTVDFNYTFVNPGKYEVRLKAYNADSTCFGTSFGNIIVDCGVAARFSPDKRIIASQTGKLEDSVFFWNKSYGASDYKWFVSDANGGNIQMVSTLQDLTYTFPEPGLYSIQLEASNGSCNERSATYQLRVLDPTADPVMNLIQVDCYKEDSLKVVFEIFNNGYDTIPKGIPISFYDRIRTSPGAIQLLNDFILPDSILGKCNSRRYEYVISAGGRKPDTLYAEIDPNNILGDINPTNNSGTKILFQFRIRISPSDTTVFVNSDIRPIVIGNPRPAISVQWQTTGGINCTDCLDPILTVLDTTKLKAFAQNDYGCSDSTETMVYIFPIDIGIKTKNVFCYKNDSLLVETEICLGNGFKNIKSPFELSFVDRDTTNANAQLLGSGLVDINTNFNNGCALITSRISKTSSGIVYAYANRIGNPFESNKTNNSDSIVYTDFRISILQPIINIYRGEEVTIATQVQGEPYRSIQWNPSTYLSCTNCPEPTFKSNTNGKYQVKITSTYECLDSADVEINVFYQKRLAIPNVFTPDDDGLNDVFYIIAGTEVKALRSFQIFNRWGEKVYEARNAKPNDVSAGWKGMHKGQKAAQGTYAYVVEIVLDNGTTEIHKGTITLLR